MLTLFTSCKPFQGEDAIAQRNAITSWKMLRPEPEIFILGDDFGAREFAEEIEVQFFPKVKRNESGKPFVDDLFNIAQRAATNDICCYVNSDIILLSDFISGVQKVASKKKDFLLIGKRHDLDVKETMTFETGWEHDIRNRVLSEGRPYHLPGMDYFVFRKGQWGSIFPFVLGNIRWDNWIVYEARRNKITTVDATDAIMVIHQNHKLKHAEESDQVGIEHDSAAVHNLSLYGKGLTAFFNLDASHVLTKNGLKLALSKPYLERRLITTPIFSPKMAPLCNLLRRVIL
jgi:hypothetical protein